MTTNSEVPAARRLTQCVRKGGCASKIGPAALRQVLATLPQTLHDDLIVGLETSDDAGVIRLTDDLALVQTLDFFTPIVDDPFEFGRIAATNALSDVYAMGGIPITAMNIVGFPITELPPETLAEILRGGASVLEAANVRLVGGHSVDDPEPKFGLSVTGTIHPERVATNAGLRVGDILVLTKALGTGIVTTALRKQACPAEFLDAAVASMTTLNAAAADAMRFVGIGSAVSAATDVTGFGLLGHLSHMVRAANVSAQIHSDALPILPGALSLAADGFTTGGAQNNAAYLEEWVRIDERVPANLRDILYDPQTSGGLLIGVARESLPALLDALKSRGVAIAAVVGEITAGPASIRVV